MRDKEVFTTGEAARLCQVETRTVSNWFDSGKLRGFRIPGGRSRRIPRANLVRFLRDHGMAVPLELQARVRLLLVGSGLTVSPAELNLPHDAYDVQSVATAFEAGAAMSTYRPNGVIIDLAMGRAEAVGIVQAIRRLPGQAETLVVGLVNGTDPDMRGLEDVGFTVLMPRDSDMAGLIRGAVELCGGKVESVSSKEVSP